MGWGHFGMGSRGVTGDPLGWGGMGWEQIEVGWGHLGDPRMGWGHLGWVGGTLMWLGTLRGHQGWLGDPLSWVGDVLGWGHVGRPGAPRDGLGTPWVGWGRFGDIRGVWGPPGMDWGHPELGWGHFGMGPRGATGGPQGWGGSRLRWAGGGGRDPLVGPGAPCVGRGHVGGGAPSRGSPCGAGCTDAFPPVPPSQLPPASAPTRPFTLRRASGSPCWARAAAAPRCPSPRASPPPTSRGEGGRGALGGSW